MPGVRATSPIVSTSLIIADGDPTEKATYLAAIERKHDSRPAWKTQAWPRPLEGGASVRALAIRVRCTTMSRDGRKARTFRQRTYDLRQPFRSEISMHHPILR